MPGLQVTSICRWLVVEPKEARLYEVVRRRTDQALMVRSYTPIGRRLLEDAGRSGPTVLSEASRTRWAVVDILKLPQHVGDPCER